jgi:hypothetical protein
MTWRTLLGLAPPPLRTVYVQTLQGNTIRGALLHRRADAFVLRGAWLADQDPNGNEKWSSLDGDVVIPVRQIEFYQEGIDPTALQRNM